MLLLSIKIENSDEGNSLQELLFSRGFHWIFSGVVFRKLDSCYINISNDSCMQQVHNRYLRSDNLISYCDFMELLSVPVTIKMNDILVFVNDRGSSILIDSLVLGSEYIVKDFHKNVYGILYYMLVSKLDGSKCMITEYNLYNFVNIRLNRRLKLEKLSDSYRNL